MPSGFITAPIRWPRSCRSRSPRCRRSARGARDRTGSWCLLHDVLGDGIPLAVRAGYLGCPGAVRINPVGESFVGPPGAYLLGQVRTGGHAEENVAFVAEVLERDPHSRGRVHGFLLTSMRGTKVMQTTLRQALTSLTTA